MSVTEAQFRKALAQWVAVWGWPYHLQSEDEKNNYAHTVYAAVKDVDDALFVQAADCAVREWSPTPSRRLPDPPWIIAKAREIAERNRFNTPVDAGPRMSEEEKAENRRRLHELLASLQEGRDRRS